ncbi:MAG: ATP-binding protein [Candidatus Ozemobacteraceae bacterium]
MKRSQVVVLVGPRQCGKTTLAREFLASESPNYFDLEDPTNVGRLEEAMTTLKPMKKLIVIDEVQRRPELFPVLRVLADRKPLPARFLILGSASPSLLRQSSESLAGRVEILPMSGFSLDEVGIKKQATHWLRGGFPRSFLAKSLDNSCDWRENFIKTFYERDLPQFGITLAPVVFHRFLMMLAHYHGQIGNASEIGRSLGVSETSIRRYLDILDGVFLVRQLHPWHENLKKRQIKNSKLYFRDSGILHKLLEIRDMNSLLAHPKCGASWEGYILDEIAKANPGAELFFWATHNGAELDLLLMKNGKRYGVEMKRADAPRLTPSMKTALEDLHLDHLFVIYPGNAAHTLSEKVSVLPLENIIKPLDHFKQGPGGAG